MYYWMKDGEWSRLGSLHDGSDEPANMINVATELSVTIPGTGYLMESWGTGWVGGDVAKWLAVEGSGYMASAMNDDFDNCRLLWLGRVNEATHSENAAYLSAEELSARWLREPITLEDNVVEEVTITTVTDADTLTFPAATFSADEHNNRGCRIIAKDAANLNVFIGAFDADGGFTFSGQEGGAGTHQDALVGDGYEMHLYRNGGAYIDYQTEILLRFYFKYPKRANGASVKLKLQPYNTGATGINNAVGLGAYDTYFPRLYIMKSDGTTAVALKTWTNDEAEGGADTWTEITIELQEDDLYLYEQVVDATYVRLDFKMYSGTWKRTADDKYFAHIGCDVATATVQQGYQHDPVEFQIADTTATTLELTVDAGTMDLNTERVNNGDTVQVLYRDDEMLETVLDASPYNDGLSSIDAPTSTKPTFNDFNYMPISQFVRDAMDRNAWYWYQSRGTTSGEPTVYFKEKGDPPDYGLLVDTSDIDGDGNITVTYNAQDKVRQVIVKNKNNIGKYPTSPSSSDLPVLVLNRPDVPDAYLTAIATAVYNQRSAVGEDTRLTIRTVQQSSDNFEYDDGEDIDTRNGWAVNAGTFVGASGRGYLSGGYIDGATPSIINTFDSAGDETGMVAFKLESNGKTMVWGIANAALSSVGANIMVITGQSTFYVIQFGGAPSNTGATFTANTEHEIELIGINATQFDIKVDGTLYDNAGTHWSTYSPGGCDSLAKLLMVDASGPGEATMYMDDLQCDWLGDGTWKVHEAPNLHVGALLRVKAMPHTKAGTDWRFNKSLPIRSILWKNDGTADLALGFAEQEMVSVEESVQDAVSRALGNTNL